ncbi:hypothetical protein V3C99_017099 [Haemonchus contortus]
MILWIPLLYVSLKQVASNSVTFTSKCFLHKVGHGVSNSYSNAELFRVTVGDCLNYCILNAAKTGDGCASVVYHTLHSTCQLYGHNGHFNGSQVVPAIGHDFYERTSWVGVCRDKVVPKHGYRQRPLQYAALEVTNGGSSMEFRTGQAASTSFIPTTTRRTWTTSNFDEPTVGTRFLNPTHSSECQRDETVSYFVFFGYRLTSTKVAARLKGVDQSSCIMYCSQNIDASGVAVPCYAANYEPADEECYLYGMRPRLDRNTARLDVNTNFIFADKFCVQTKKDCSAETPYIVYPTKQMHKKIIMSYPGMNSVVACIAACIDNRKCKAATYKIGLCILHAASPASDSSLLVDGHDQTMVIENGCQLTTKLVPSLLSNNLEGRFSKEESQWEEWGLCRFSTAGRRVRVRQRKCMNCEDLQMDPC